MHMLPELKKLEQAYPNNVVVIGVHSGKFDTEHDSQSIRQAVLRYEIEHPVVNDADYKIWNRYGCRSWPTLRAIDPQGNVVAEQSGEIDFATLDAFFQQNVPAVYRAKGLLMSNRCISGTKATPSDQRRYVTRGRFWRTKPASGCSLPTVTTTAYRGHFARRQDCGE